MRLGSGRLRRCTRGARVICGGRLAAPSGGIFGGGLAGAVELEQSSGTEDSANLLQRCKLLLQRPREEQKEPGPVVAGPRPPAAAVAEDEGAFAVAGGGQGYGGGRL